MIHVSYKSALLNQLAKDTYPQIKDNHNIPQDIKDSWLELCVTSCDIYELCNY